MPEDMRKASLLLRVIAKLIDFILVAVAIKVIPQIGYVAGLIYLLISDGLFDGRSVGKKVLKLKVVSFPEGNPGTFKRSIIRNIPFFLALLLFPLPLIGWIFGLIILVLESLLMLGNEDGMRLGDDLAQTKVIEG